MKKLKFILFVALVGISSIIFVGCSCKKEINPVSIIVTSTTEVKVVGDIPYSFGFAVYPQNATNTSVNITNSNDEVVTINETYINSANGSITVTIVGVGSSVITFAINGTTLQTTHTVSVYDPAPLATPADLRYDDDTQSVVFTSVPNASSYHLKINDQIVEVTDPYKNNISPHNVSYKAFGSGGNLETGKPYSVQVRAVGDGRYYTSSSYGDYVDEPLEFLKLSSPKNLNAQGNVVSWEHSELYEEGFVSYVVSVNDQEQEAQTENSFTVNVVDAKDYKIKVKAVVNDQQLHNIFNSEYSSLVTINKLLAPTELIIYNNLKQSGIYQNSVFTWAEVIGANSYEVAVSPALLDGTDKFTIPTSANRQVVIDDNFKENEQYTLSVRAIGGATSTLASDYRSYSFKKLAPVSNVRMVEETLYFDVLNITAQVQYEVLLTKDSITTQHIVLGGSLSLSDIATEFGTYSVVIRSLAFHDIAGNQNYANSIAYQTGLSFVKLQAPTVNKITNNGIIYWDLVEHATVYDIYYDDILVSTLQASLLEDEGVYNLAQYNPISAGDHTVSLVALGTGAPNIINSSYYSKINYDFKKLPKPANLNVINDEISWEQVTGAYNYIVSENGSLFKSNGSEITYKLENPLSENVIKVVAGGNDTNIINSDESLFLVNKLLAPTNLRTINGVLYFNYDENNYYRIYVNNIDLGVVITDGKYAFSNNLPIGETTEVAVKAYPKTTIDGHAYLSSEKTYCQLTKLISPTEIINTKKADNSETYTLSWQAVVGAINYRLVITDKNNVSTEVVQSNTYYNIPTNWAEGYYEIKVFALGNSVSLPQQIGVINSNESAIYQIVKLAPPTNVRVNEGKVIWDASKSANNATPIEYELKVIYLGETNYYRTGNTSYNIETLSGSYEIGVRAIGPVNHNMTSDWSVFKTLDKLNKIANLRVNNGVIAWDAYNETYGTGISVVYDLYLTTFESGERQLVKADHLQTSYVISENISKNKTHYFEVVVKAETHLDSDLSSKLEFVKLDDIVDFKIEEQIFSWTANPYTLGYEIINTTGGVNTVYALLDDSVLTYAFNEGNNLLAGTYTFKIRAIGGINNEVNYINGDYNETVTVTILSSVSNMQVNGGKITWDLSYGVGEDLNTPVSYDIYVYEILGEDELSEPEIYNVANTVTEFDFAVLGSGNYIIEIISVGNNKDKISSSPTILELVTKIDATEVNLRTEKGVVMWDAFIGENVEYELYLNNEAIAKITNTSYLFNNLIPMQQYNFKILVYADGYLSSSFSNEITLVKLPQVQNFKILQNANPDQPHYFMWDLVTNAGTEIAEGYEIMPQSVVEEFNGGANKGENTLYFTITKAGSYSFKIRPIGSSNNEGISYLNGEYGSSVTVVVLDTVKNLEVKNNSLTFAPSPLFVSNDTTPDSFKIKVYSINLAGEEELVAEKVLTNAYLWDLKQDNVLLPWGVYVVKIYSVGSQNHKVTSAAAIIEDVCILKAPENVKITSGLLDFELSSAEGINVLYEIYLNGSLFLTIENNSESEVQKLSNALETTGTNNTLKIRAIAVNAIYSVFSEEIIVSKLASVTGIKVELKNNVSMLYWTNVLNANSYRLLINPIVEELYNLPYYNLSRNWFALTMSGADGFALPVNLPPNTYYYKFYAVGNTTLANSGEIGFLTSNSSAENQFIVMEAPSGLRLEDGIIKWNKTTGAVRYLLNFYNTAIIDEDTPVFKTTNVTNLEYDINSSEFVSGEYVLRIFALGDGINYISSTTYEEITVIRGETLSSYKILNGYISWMVTESQIINQIGGSGSLNGDDITLLNSIFNGSTEGISAVLLKNLYPLYNIEFTINGAKYLSTPSTVLNVGKDFFMFYEVNLPSGNYVISARGRGNTPAGATEDGLNLSVVTEPAVYNYAYTLKTTEINAYKLASPVTPVYQSPTSIVNNRFYWTTVTTPSSDTISDYYILARSKDGSGTSIIHLQTVAPEIITPSIDIRDIKDMLTSAKIPAGFLYNIAVVARGTPDSTLNSGTNYLTSSYTNISEVEILAEPQQLKILNGVVSFAKNAKAQYHLIKIWNNGTSYETASNDPANYLIRREIKVDADTLLTDNNLWEEEGIYYYNFENNDLFPSHDTYAYKIKVLAQGDGTYTISSTEDITITVAKWKNVALAGAHAITIESGAYKWNHVKFLNPLDGKYVYPENYKVIVIRTSDVDETKEFEIIYNVGTTTDPFIYFELPDTDDYPSSIYYQGDTHYYTYKITVSAYGSIVGSGNLQFATSNSVVSKIGQRLDIPQNVTTVKGIINWNYVQFAASYDVYVSEQFLGDSDTYKNGNIISFVMNTNFLSGTYNLRVRANSNTSEFLNSRKSSEIKIVKLDTPNLRIQNGEVKWNNNDLPFAITTYTLLQVTGPDGFSGADLEGFSESDFTLSDNTYSTDLPYDHVANTAMGLNFKGTTDGSYNVLVQYIGSDGAVSSGSETLYLATSDEISFNFTKLTSPVIEISSSETVDGNVKNFIKWDEINFATNYNVVVFKETESGLKLVKFNNKSSQGSYFEYVDGHYEFNLKAVSDYDNNNPDQEPFGDSYFVYCEAYGDDSSAKVTELRFSMSNNSNTEAVAIPITPNNLMLNEYGAVSWTNRSDMAKPVLEISYLLGENYTETELIELPIGTTSYKLTEISINYRIRIKSIIGTLEDDGIMAQSEFSDMIEGAFDLFASGRGEEAKPYAITDAKHLFNINYYPHSYFIILNNIDTSIYAEYSQWKPIGVANLALNISKSDFSGNLNGNGYSINTISYSAVTQTDLAFIHTIAKTGVVRNLTVNVNGLNLNVSYFGGISVHNYGSIENVTVTGSVHLQQNRTDTFVGGISTYNYEDATIYNSVNNATLISNTNSTTNTTSLGGVVYRNYGILSKVGNNGTLTGTSMGGVVYINQGVVTQSYNKGALNSVANVGYLRDIYVGGIAALNEQQATISYSYVLNYENISINNQSGRLSYVGGLIGNNGSTGIISNSYAVFKPGVFNSIGTVQFGAIAGNSAIYDNNYENVYYQSIGESLLAIGNRSGVINGIAVKTETEMKQPVFASLLNNNFVAVVNGYPILSWEL